MALYLDYTPLFVAVWSLADLLEGLIPRLAFRALKVELNYSLKKAKITYGLTVLLAADFAVLAAATILTLTEVFVASFVVGLVGLCI